MDRPYAKQRPKLNNDSKENSNLEISVQSGIDEVTGWIEMVAVDDVKREKNLLSVSTFNEVDIVACFEFLGKTQGQIVKNLL